ncbi:hypothetical protein GCM10011579_015030 [Streptomyces albiflavescens]|uniref:Uncharacterized protein n=1 Tax=Streptomyces albiflavescens TaxID=1623582 RepID=A0A917XWX3_9ACTN|nr:hypothetical protein GCM10011579_015030 [Streptomyces albiflavescens]
MDMATVPLNFRCGTVRVHSRIAVRSPAVGRAEAVRVCGAGASVADDASPAAYESLVGGTMVLAGV